MDFIFGPFCLITSACVRMFSVPSVGMTMYFIFLPCLLTETFFFNHAVFVLLIYAETVFYLCWSGKMYPSFYFLYLYCVFCIKKCYIFIIKSRSTVTRNIISDTNRGSNATIEDANIFWLIIK